MKFIFTNYFFKFFAFFCIISNSVQAQDIIIHETLRLQQLQIQQSLQQQRELVSNCGRKIPTIYGELDFCTILKHRNSTNIINELPLKQRKLYSEWLGNSKKNEYLNNKLTTGSGSTIENIPSNFRPLNNWWPDNATKNMEVIQKYPNQTITVTPAIFKKPTYAVVRVFFATDRNYIAGKIPKELFGNERSNLTFGTIDVTIPRDHRMGDLESPSLIRLEFNEDSSKHITLRKVSINSKDEYFKNLAVRLNESKKSNAFIFIHGYNVSFEDAAKRTAQISYDLAFDGAPVFYSWPSQGSSAQYSVDEQMIEWTQSNFKSFLDDFFKNTKAENIYLIAHSMGNRALTRAVITLLSEKPELSKRITEVILTAPDIDADVFKRDIAPALINAGRPITLYASSDDVALKASKKIHGANRAGDSGVGLVVMSGIETVDASGIDSSLIGHSYYAESRNVLSDLYSLISNGHRADKRFGLQKVESKTGNHWIFKK